MKGVRRPLLCLAGALWLSTYSSIDPSSRAQADDVVLPVQVQEVAVFQQMEQQFAPQFRQAYQAELHFMRLVCQPTKQQNEKITAEGDAALKVVIKKFVEAVQGPRRGGVRLVASERADPRRGITDALLKSVQTTLTPEQAARYQKELEQRTEARKRVVVLNLVAQVDRALVLTAEQRTKLGDILQKKWQESWNQTQLFLSGGQYLPSMPDADILPILTETQKNRWNGIAKGQVDFGFDFGFVQGIEVPEEAAAEVPPPPPPEKPEPKRDPARPVEKL